MRIRIAPSAALLALSFLTLAGLTLVGCDSNDADDPDPVGSFNVTVTGSAQASLRGQAAFASGTDDGETVTAVGLVDSTDDEDIVILVLPGAPRAATFDVADGAAGGFLALSSGDEGALYGTTEGTITITSATGDRLRGRFDVTATSLVDENDEVTITGSFEAERGEVDTDF